MVQDCADLEKVLLRLGFGPSSPDPPDLFSVPASEICSIVCSWGTYPDMPDHMSLKCHEAPVRTSPFSPQVSETSSSLVHSTLPPTQNGGDNRYMSREQNIL